MDFAFSEEQQMLRSQAREFLADKFPSERVAELAQSDDGWDRSSLAEMAELGWTGLAVSEEEDGAGMGFIEEAVLFEELGYALYPGPFFSSVALALPALIGSEFVQRVVAGEPATLAWAEPSGPYTLSDLEGVGTKAEQSGGTWELTGDKHLVPDGSSATLLVVAARAADGLGLWAAEADAVQTQPQSTMDASRRFAHVSLKGVPATMVAEPGSAEQQLERIRRRALAALALEGVGIAQKALELAKEHVQTRQQFGKPIGTYQAVSHRVADIYMETELARSLAYWAAWCVAEEDDQAPVAVAAAKAAASEAAVGACERSIQVHGGIGFTWEHILHRYYKRAQWIDSFEGFSSAHRADVASSLLDD